MEKTKDDVKVINTSGSCQNLTPIDYNYPSLGRKDCMYLSTVNNFDAPLKKFKQLNTNRNWSINLYNLDIEGSSPRRFGAFNQKTDYINKNDDIERSSPKMLHIKLNKPEYNLNNDDIEFSKPHCIKMNCKRHLNPLEPKYNLPDSEPFPQYQPKFIRDSIKVDDIEGARPRKIVSQTVLRESLKKDDILDSWPRKPYIRKSKYEYLDYRDVTNTYFQTRRNTNPLNPFYSLMYNDKTKTTVGPIEGNHPEVFSKFIYKNPYNLKLDDIEGSNIGSKNTIKKFNGSNSCYNSRDIEGAQSGTLLKGIKTNRVTNPIWPKYKYPGVEELKGYYENNPYNNLNKNFSSSSNIKNNTASSKKLDSEEKTKEIKTHEKILTEGSMEKEENKSPSSDIKILNKKVKITKEGNQNKNIKDEYKVFIRPDGKPDFGNLPFVEDKIVFDKDKYKKPDVYYSLPHDKYLIPPIEEFKKNEIKVNPELRSFQQVNKERINLINHPKMTSLGSEPFKTYATKLDDFMAEANLKYIANPKPKQIPSYVETGLPDNLNEQEIPAENNSQNNGNTKSKENSLLKEGAKK